MKIVKGSDNFIYELERYTWAKDRHGKLLNEPVDAWNDLCDCGRYAVRMMNIAPAEGSDTPGLINVHPKDPAGKFDYNNPNLTHQSTDDETVSMSKPNFGEKRYKPVFTIRYNGDFDDYRRGGGNGFTEF